MNDKKNIEFKLSQYQENIIEHISNKRGSLFVNAVAGASKTFTIVEASKYIDSDSCLFLAFNVHIAEELKKKLPPYFEIRTVNGLGYKIFKDNFGQATVTKNKVDEIIDEIIRVNKDAEAKEYRKGIKKLVSLAKLNGLVPLECDVEEVEEYKTDCHSVFMEHIYEENTELFNYVEDKADDSVYDFDVAFEKIADAIVRVSIEVLCKSIKDVSVIDFDDQIYMPIIYGLKGKSYEYVLCDEAQDLSPIQLELISRCVDDKTLVCGVGDPRQSIYAWRGADEDAVGKFVKMFNCEVKPLSICYRCPKEVVRYAQKYNPIIEYWDQSCEGKVVDLGEKYSVYDFKENHTILSRFNSSLLSMALKLIVAKVPFRFEGRNFGEELIRLVKKMKAEDLNDLMLKLEEWFKKKEAYLREKDRLEDLTPYKDKFYSLKVIRQCLVKDNSVQSIIDFIENNFGDNSTGVKLSTIHKAKGLESDVVWILDMDKLPFVRKKKGCYDEVISPSQQEINVTYVALTRAKKEMYFIRSDKDFRDRFYEGIEEGREIVIDKVSSDFSNRKFDMVNTIKGNQEFCDMAKAILRWAEDNDWFDATVIKSILSQAEMGKRMSEKQAALVEKIYYRFASTSKYSQN